MAAFIRKNHADVAMSFMMIIWGLNFIAIKNGLEDFSPVTFNAIRFTMAVPLLALFGWRGHIFKRMERRDVLYLVGLVGPLLLGLQCFWVLGQDRTTATNSALLHSTAPMWTAIVSILAGMLQINRKLVLGVMGTVVGVALVFTGQPDADISLSSDDMLGNIFIVISAMCFAGVSVLSKRLADRYGGLVMGIYAHWITWFGLVLLASPDLVTLRAEDFPLDVFPNLLFSAFLANAFGYLLYNYSIKVMGPTRASMYTNFLPIFAALGAYFLLDESLTAMLIVGGIVTLASVVYVRRHARNVDPTLPNAVPRFLSRRTRAIEAEEV